MSPVAPVDKGKVTQLILRGQVLRFVRSRQVRVGRPLATLPGSEGSMEKPPLHSHCWQFTSPLSFSVSLSLSVSLARDSSL